jgi:integrase
LTLLCQLRIICRRLLGTRAPTITALDVSRLARHHRALAQDLQQAVLRAGTSPEDELRKDIWNTAVLGHGRRPVIDFTGISQAWLREALKRWVAEELPARRGDHATAILRDHVHRTGELSASLRLHHDDHGDDPRALARGDIIAFLSRLAHRQATGQMSSWRRSTTCRQVAMILRECRVLGLTRPGQPMSGLPDDFAVRRDDIPQQASDDEPGRALPAGVLNQLITALPLLEQSAGPALRAAVELLMDTGRRPTEVCKLGWDCLDQDSDGKYALIYTDFKANRAGRRLPITDQTATVIIGQQQRVCARYPDTPAAELAKGARLMRNTASWPACRRRCCSPVSRSWPAPCWTAHSRGIRAAFVAGDEVYGGRELRGGIRQREMGYVMTVRTGHALTTGPGRTVTAAAAVSMIPARAWHRMRTGSGTKSTRHYDWAML